MWDGSNTTGTKMEFEDYKNLLNHVFQTAPIGLCLFDKDLRYRHINEWLASINGLSVDEHLGRLISEVIPDVSEQVELLLRRVMETREPLLDGIVEAETPASPQKKRIFQHSYNPIISKEGVVVGVSCVVQDITRRKKAEQASEDKQVQLDNLLSNVDAIVLEGDPFDINYVGGQVEKILGYTKEMWFEHPQGPVGFWSEILHPDDKCKIEICLQAIKRSEDHSFECRLIAKNGQPIWFYDSVIVETDNGRPTKTRSVMVDITERKKAENALRESEDRARTLLNATHDSAFLVEPSSGTIFALNETAAQHFGKSINEIIGSRLHDFVPSDLAESRLAKGQEVVHSGKPVHFQDEREGMYFDITLYPVFDISGEVMQLAVFAQNITERKLAEASLKDSKQRLSIALDAVGGGVFDWDIANDVWMRSDSWYELMGYQRNELESWEAEHGSIIHPDDIDGMEVAFQAHVREECDRYLYEFRIHHKSGEWRWLLGQGLIVDRAEDGSPLRMVGTDTDITERKKAEDELVQARRHLEERVKERTAELIQSESRQGLLLESTKAIPWEADAKTYQFTYVGRQAGLLLGYAPQMWLENDFWVKHIHPDDRDGAIEYCVQSATCKTNYEFEYRMIAEDGRTVWIHDIVNVELECGKPKTLRGFMIDVTERKKAEDAASKNSKRLIKAQQVSRMGFLELNLKTQEIIWSKEVYNLYGIDPDAPVTLEQTVDLVHPDDQEFAEQNLKMAIEGNCDLDIDHRVVRPNGEVIWVNARADLERDNEGVPTSLIGTVVDITARKQLEEKLIIANKKTQTEYAELEQLYKSIPVGLCLIDRDFRYIRINKMMADINGSPVDAHIGKTVRELIPQLADEIEKAYNYVFDTGEPIIDYEITGTTHAKPDKVRSWLVSYYPMTFDNGEAKFLSTVVTDITERKQAEEKLTESATRLQLATDATRIGHWDWDIITNKVYLSPEWKRQIGYEDHEIPNQIETWESHLHPDDRESTIKLVDDYINGRQENFEVEFRLSHKDGSYRWIYTRAEKQIDDTGKACRLFGCHMDITDRKNAEKLLLDSEARFRMIYEHAPVMIDAFDDRGRCFMFNKECEKVFGWTAEEVFSHDNPLELFYPEPEIQRQVIETVSSKPEKVFREWKPVRKDGSETTCLWANFNLPDGQVINLGYDITEQKQAEDKFMKLLEAAPEAMVITDQDGRIKIVNAQTERVFGYDRKELIGENVEMLLPEGLRLKHVKYRQNYVQKPSVRAMGSGLDLVALHEDGHQIPVEIGLSPCQTSDGLIVITSIRDISEQKYAKVKLRQNRDEMRVLARRLITAHEDERRRLARELHDDLSQRLASIAIDSSMLENEIRPIDEVGANKLAKLADRIRDTSVDIHQVSRQLHPSILDELGLVKAMQAECDTFQRRSGIALHFDGPSEYNSYAKSTELALYRIMQECLRNIEKHARAVSATVGLIANEDNISLIVTDTGTGFDPTQQREEPGLGMASLRERAGLLGGTVSIKSEIGQGTTVTTHLPIKAEVS